MAGVKAIATQSNGTMNRREDRLYHVIPGDRATEKKLDRFQGEYRRGKTMVPYTAPRAKGNDADQFADGLGSGVDAEIINDAKGRPMVVLHGRAAELAAAQGLTHWSISLSHEREYGVAFVVAISPVTIYAHV